MHAKELIESGRYTCVGQRGTGTLFALRGNGIKPLILLYETAPGLLAGTVLHDKVIGKAAAMMAVLAGVSSIWGNIMSQSAIDFLTARGVPHSYGTRVERITNRMGDGICPLEATVLPIDDPAEAYPALKAKIADLMAGRA